ncbi:hypothetical protein ACFXAZ_34505 [Streptomyces sp. NPDC059477]|uniref:hypothetical protein n=1 Tax=Streptomyces sp. NPDC059477 TaxID=3346847 RepID=UPI0036CAE612
MSTTRRALGAGQDIPEPVRDPRARTAAERAADGAWVAEQQEVRRVPPGGRRRLGTGGGADHQEQPVVEREDE